MHTKGFLLLLTVFLVSSTPVLAQYPPAPEKNLAAIQGEWKGTLTYKDYQPPHDLVKLPTEMIVALSSPSTLILTMKFDDGPDKTVWSYETMHFDFPAKTLKWSSHGTEAPLLFLLTRIEEDDSDLRLTFNQNKKGTVTEYEAIFTNDALSLVRNEISSEGEKTFRNRYELTRRTP